MPNTTAPFVAAAVQAAPAFLDLDAGIDKAIGLIADAADRGAQLVAFPETWLPGYPWWIWLGSPAWGMQFVGRYHANSLVLDSPPARRLFDAAAEHDINVVLGYSERDGGSLYLGQAIVSREGELVAARRKLKPTHVERSVFGEGDGSSLTVVDLDVGRVGALCCWEHLQPLNRFALFSMDEQIHVGSWPSFCLYTGAAYALGPEVNTAASQTYAAEGQCFVIASCATVSEEMLDLLADTPDKRRLLTTGGGHSMIFGPDGRPLAEPLPPDEEGLVLAEIDLGQIAFAKAAGDPAGHYARPDVTRLLLNTDPAPPVQRMPEAFAEVASEPAEPAVSEPVG